MAITANCSKFLFYCKSLGVNYDCTLMLGRLSLYAKQKDIEKQIKYFQNNIKTLSEVDFSDGYSEPLFEILGAEKIDSIDYSDYEGPTLVHDLNQPVPSELKNKYSVIMDGGTLEHVFNFPVAIRNCMEMLSIGGHFIAITPTNNFSGHGFYQFSPELYYNIFDKVNGFNIIKLAICTVKENGTYSDWYEVANPRRIKSRVIFTNSLPTFMMVVAKKVESTEIFKTTPQQSDYESLWAMKIKKSGDSVPKGSNKLLRFYREVTPMPIKKIFYYIFHFVFTKSKMIKSGIGKVMPGQFKKIRINN